MSNEFRETYGHFFWEHLREAAGIDGQHEVTNVLSKVYAALAPLELDCASFEASDSGWHRPASGAIKQIRAIESAVNDLRALAYKYEDLVRFASFEKGKA